MLFSASYIEDQDTFVFAAISDARDLLLHQEQLPAELLQVSSLLSHSFFTRILKLQVNSVTQHS